MYRSTNRRSSVAEPEVWFRIVHVAVDGADGAPVAAYREQTVEIALGPKGAFENGNIGTLTRRVAADRVVSAVPPPRGKPKPPKEPETPRVVELLRKAIEWQALLESGEAANQAAIARREGLTRARVTQVMGLLRLAPEEISPARFFPKMAAACHDYVIAEWTVQEMIRLNPGKRLRRPRWQGRRFTSVSVEEILVEKRNGRRRRRKFCKARRVWKSLAHVPGGKKLT